MAPRGNQAAVGHTVPTPLAHPCQDVSPSSISSSTRMTAVTSLAVVTVTTHLAMMGVRSRLFMLVTVDAGELVEIARPVTVGAIESVWSREREPMIEIRLVPRSVGCQMAILAVRREA